MWNNMNQCDPPDPVGEQFKQRLATDFEKIMPQTIKKMFRAAVYPSQISFDRPKEVGDKQWTIHDEAFAILIHKK